MSGFQVRKVEICQMVLFFFKDTLVKAKEFNRNIFLYATYWLPVLNDIRKLMQYI